jgi:hypothetical protein
LGVVFTNGYRACITHSAISIVRLLLATQENILTIQGE